jgi:two-component system phosphate regulon sensor histidine kinase PhoR
MKQSFRSITILLTVILLLPAFFFSGFELFQMNKNEKEIENIYSKQLDAILFSINLYSEDIINSWASKIRLNIKPDDKLDCINLKNILSDASQIRSVVFSNEIKNQRLTVCTFDSLCNLKILTNEINALLKDSLKKINKLKSYYKGGYFKIEQLGIGHVTNSEYIIFLFGNDSNYRLCMLEIDQGKFIKELLGQKIQVTAENNLNIGVVNHNSGKLLYSSGALTDSSELQVKKPLWLFPQYEIGIKLKDKSIQVLSKERNRLNLFFILLADFVFILGALVVFWNIRKEIRLAQIKSEFTSNVSHEIRTPLARISMYAETLEMGRVPNEEKKKEYYGIIYNETQRLSGIVNRILSFSKIEEGKRAYIFTSVKLNDLVTKIMQSYNFHLKNKGFECQINLSQDLPVISADAEAITDAVINLLDNAVKYSLNEKYIEISTGSKSGYIFIEISDKGVGIAKEEQKLVFEKYYRASRGNLAHFAKGTGLGLTIVKNIIDAHKGKVGLESKPGEGSKFRILLPV